MVRRAAAEDISIGIGFNRGTNMHPISLMADAVVDPLRVVGEASFSWIIAAVLGACLIGLSN